MSFFEDASLVLIPSAQKTSKVYSVKPTDGTGDLTFTRSNDTATRVGPDGLIEKVRTNVVLYSENQSNAAYSSVINQITSRTAVANPLTGSSNAYKILSAGGTDPYIGQTITGLSNGENTFSLWLWTDSGQDVNCDLIFYNATASEIYTKSVTLTTTPTRYDHTVNFTTVGASATIRLDLCQSCGVTYVYTYGWQVETGVATDYIATTSAAVSVGPVANVPRLDYLNSSCPRLLLEPQRTNLYNYSEQLNQWTSSGSTVTANYAVSPDGYTNADRVQFTAGSVVFFSGTGSAGENTLSVYAKATNGVSGDFRFFGNGATTLSSNQTATGEWQRFTFTYTYSAVTAGLAAPTSGGGISDVIFYGFQHEIGAYATSYIPTLGAAVTRGQDVTSKSSISSLIGQANGTAQMTFVMDSDTSADSTTMLGIHASTSTANRIQLLSRFGSVRLLVVANNSIVSNVLLYDAAPDEVVNVAFKYGSAGVTAYVNGTQVYTTASAVVFTETMELFTIGNRSGIDEYGKGQRVSQSLLFPTALSNSDLAALTA